VFDYGFWEGVRCPYKRVRREMLSTSDRDWRRQHAQAVINALVSTLAFVHVAERARVSICGESRPLHERQQLMAGQWYTLVPVDE
jgi:hypothetical protein